MCIFKLATLFFKLLISFIPLYIFTFYSSFTYSHGVPYPGPTENFAPFSQWCQTLYPDSVCHDHHNGKYWVPQSGDTYPPEPDDNDCPPAGPVPDVYLSYLSSPPSAGDTILIDGCEYTVVAAGGVSVGNADGWHNNVSLDSTGRSEADYISDPSSPPENPLISSFPDGYDPVPTPRDDNSSTPSSPVTTSESSSSVSNSDGSTTGSGTVSTIKFNDDGSVTDKTTKTVTNTSSSGSVTGTTTTETSTTRNSNGSSSTSTTVTETDANGVSQVVFQSSGSDNEVVDEEGGSISGGKSCSAPPTRSGDVSDGEYNQILQTYYLRCPPETGDPTAYKPDGFNQSDLDSKLSEAQQQYTDFISDIKQQAESLFSISLNSSGNITKDIVSIRGADVDFSLFRFMAELSIIGQLIIALAYIRAFFIITSSDK